MKASIIIPIYNAEKYLEECINSALNQTMSKDEYEILLIDDFSSDKSMDIIEKYINVNSNINLIKHNKNQGVSSTLNDGIRNAKGKYIFTMACDDIVDEKMLEICYTTAERNKLDAVYFGCIVMYDPNDKENIKYHVEDGTKVISPKIESYVIMTGKEAFKKESWMGPEFMFFFNKDFIINSDLLFDENVATEDTEFMPRLYIKCERMMKIDYYLYKYRIRMGSVSYKKRNEKIIKSLEISINNLCKIIKNCMDNDERLILSFKEYYIYELREILKSIKDVYNVKEIEINLLDKLNRYIAKYFELFGEEMLLNDYLLFDDLINEIVEKMLI